MGRKILIAGGVAGGASAAARLRRNSEEDRIIMFEKGQHVSFSNCSLPYHLSGIVKDADDLILMDPELFLTRYNIVAKTGTEVISIDREKKCVTVRNAATGSTHDEEYDKLILSPGAYPVVPDIPGIEKMNIFTVRNVIDIDNLNKFVKHMDEKEVTVIGGGYVGIEIAENLKQAGFNVTIIEASDQILRPFDYDMVQVINKVIIDNKINLIVGDKVVRFTKDKVILESGKKIEAAAVVMAIGVAPEIKLAREAGLKIGNTGAIKVNENYQTSDPDIYAVGDAIEVKNGLTDEPARFALAGPAVKQARIAADHISSRIITNESTRKSQLKTKGFIGSSAIKVFNYSAASTGLNENMIKHMNINIKYEIVRLIMGDKVWLMPDASTMHFKLLFEVPSGKILGAQAVGKGDVTKRVDIIATAIKFGATVDDLKELDLCYAPPFSTAKDIVNYAGYVGSNLLDGTFKQVNVDKVRELVKNGRMIVDVREKAEFERGHIIGAFNIPLSELRNRLDEIPKDRPVYLHCRTGQRSYNAVIALQNLGYNNVYNITGSFLGLSYYEYYNDLSQNREKIVTEYNFR